jgi:hypothetical protein
MKDNSNYKRHPSASRSESYIKYTSIFSPKASGLPVHSTQTMANNHLADYSRDSFPNRTPYESEGREPGVDFYGNQSRMSGSIKKPTMYYHSQAKADLCPSKPFSQSSTYRNHTKQLSRTFHNLNSQVTSGMGSPSKYRSTDSEWHRKSEKEAPNAIADFRREFNRRADLNSSPKQDPSMDKLSLQSGQDEQELKEGINMKFDGLLTEIQKLSEAIQKFNSKSGERPEPARPSSSYRKQAEELPEKECLSVQHEPLRKWAQVSDLKKSMDISHKFSTPQDKSHAYSKKPRPAPHFFYNKLEGEEERLSKAESSPVTYGSAKDINIDELDDRELIELRKKIDSRIRGRDSSQGKEGNKEASGADKKSGPKPVPVYSMKKPPLYTASKRYAELIQSSGEQGKDYRKGWP